MVKLVLWTEGLKVKLRGEQGAGLAEYALLLFVIAMVATAGVTAFGAELLLAFNEAKDALPSPPPNP